MDQAFLGFGTVIFIVIVYIPVFYKMNRRIGELEEELREVKQELNKFK